MTREIKLGDLGFYLKRDGTGKYTLWEIQQTADCEIVGVCESETERLPDAEGAVDAWLEDEGYLANIQEYYTGVANGKKDYLDLMQGDTPKEKREYAQETLDDLADAEDDADKLWKLCQMSGADI